MPPLKTQPFQYSVGMLARNGYFFTASPDRCSVRSVHFAFTRPGICTVSTGMLRTSGRSPPATRVANLSLYSSLDAMLICSSEPSRSFSACQNWFLSIAGGIAPGMLVMNVIG